MPVDGTLMVSSPDLMTGKMILRGTTFPDSSIGAEFGFEAGNLLGFSTGYTLGLSLGDGVEEARSRGEMEGFLAGIGVPEPEEDSPTVRFTMRAFKTTIPTGFVYWDVNDEPDLTGASSPYSPGDLTDIIIVNRVDLQS